MSPDPGSKFMGTTANLTVFALLRGQPMLRRPYLGTGEATKRQAVAAWNALPSKRRHFVAIDGQSRQRTEQNHGVKQSSPPRQLGGRPSMRSSRCPLVACLDVMGSSVPPAPMDLFGSSALCWASEFARFPKLRGYANLNPQRDDARRSARPAADEIRTGDQPQNRQALGLTVPQSLQVAADEVIE